MNIIDLKNVSKTYTKKRGVVTKALSSINLKIKSSDFLAIMGHSGSGKSTLMSIIGLLDRKFDGDYQLQGHEVKKMSKGKAAEIRGKKIGFVFQRFNLLKRATVLQNVLLPTIYNPSKNQVERALKLIEKVGLKNHASYRSNELSGGEVQRVAIARALMMKPRLLLADEPTGNLDTKNGNDIMNIFKQINKEGTTVIIITHEDEIAAFAKNIIELKDGKIITK